MDLQIPDEPPAVTGPEGNQPWSNMNMRLLFLSPEQQQQQRRVLKCFDSKTHFCTQSNMLAVWRRRENLQVSSCLYCCLNWVKSKPGLVCRLFFHLCIRKLNRWNLFIYECVVFDSCHHTDWCWTLGGDSAAPHAVDSLQPAEDQFYCFNDTLHFLHVSQCKDSFQMTK